jgi:hypothetical protein
MRLTPAVNDITESRTVEPNSSVPIAPSSRS